MKTIRISLLLSFVLLLVACAPTEREQLNGKWKVSEIYMGKDLIYSTDPAEREKIVDRVIAQQKENLPEDAWGQLEMMRKFFREKLKSSGETTLIITDNNTFESKTYGSGEPKKDKGKVVIDEESNSIELKSSSIQKYTYQLKENKLILRSKEGQQLLKLEFRRM